MARLPDSDINVTLVKNAIGVGSNNVSTLVGSDKVNMDSYYKPVVGEKSSWPKGRYGTFGWIYNYFTTSPSDGKNFPLGDSPLTKDTLFSSFGYRLGDFRKYDHSQVAPKCGVTVLDIIPFDKPFEIKCVWGDNSTESVTPKNMDTFKNMYFSVAVFSKMANEDWKFISVKTCSTKIGSGYQETLICNKDIADVPIPTNNNIRFTAFISELSMNGNTNLTCKKYQLDPHGNNSVFASSGGLAKYEMFTNKVTDYWYISGEGSSPQLNGIYLDYTLVNNTSSSMTFSNLYCVVEFWTGLPSGGGSYISRYESQILKWGNPVTVSANSSYTDQPTIYWGTNKPSNAKAIRVYLLNKEDNMESGVIDHVFGSYPG